MRCLKSPELAAGGGAVSVEVKVDGRPLFNLFAGRGAAGSWTS